MRSNNATLGMGFLAGLLASIVAMSCGDELASQKCFDFSVSTCSRAAECGQESQPIECIERLFEKNGCAQATDTEGDIYACIESVERTDCGPLFDDRGDMIPPDGCEDVGFR